MAAPCGLYLSKIMLPEQELSETRGEVRVSDESPHANAIDALASGASDGMMLALNVAAMLIAFLALLALIDYLLSDVRSGQSLWLTLAEAEGWVMVRSVLALLSAFWLLVLLANAVLRRAGAPRPLHRVLGESPERRAGSLLVLAGLFPAMLPAVDLLLLVLPERLSLGMLFGKLFAPVAFLLGVEGGDVEKLAELLGIKLAGNEFLAYARMRDLGLTERGRMIATFALTGFANFGSVGILIGGIGAMAPGRRPDLARLGARALLVGFVATLVNAAIAAVLL